MAKGQNIFKNLNKNIPETKVEDQNKPKNQVVIKPKKQQDMKPDIKPLQPIITNHKPPMTSYMESTNPERLQQMKWLYLIKFYHLATKAHFMHSLKYQTLFLAYSLAEKTIDLVLNKQLTFTYWTAGCLFMSMKYEEIYPPRLKDLWNLVKSQIKKEEYNDSELTIFESIGFDLNFTSLNTFLSQYLHATTEDQRYYIFYLLEIALNKRQILKKFNLKEIVISVIFILSSHSLYIYATQTIDGIPFSRIEECSKIIIISQTSAHQNQKFLFRKYNSDKAKCVSYRAIPHIENLTSLLVKKLDEKEKYPKIIGLCPQINEEEMIDENEEFDDVMEVIMKRYPEEKCKNPR